MTAVGLCMSVMHQPEPVIFAWPLRKLFFYAELAKVLSGRK